MTMTALTSLTISSVGRMPCRAVTSVPWPAGRDDVPQAMDIPSQAVPLFSPHARPRLKRYLLLCEGGGPLPAKLEVCGAEAVPQSAAPFSHVELVTLRENLTKGEYNYRECEARLTVVGRTITLRLGLLPVSSLNPEPRTLNPEPGSWWQWCGAERLWSGPLAEAWRIGGHLTPYPVSQSGGWDNGGASALESMAQQIARKCGDVLHGDIYLIVWRSGCVQATAHFKAGYFHSWPKEIPAFPVIRVQGASVLAEKAAVVNETEGGALIQPWDDLRVLANKTKDNRLIYLEPARPDTIPAGVSRSFRFSLNVEGGDSVVGRYRVAPTWYKACGEIESDQPGPATELALRSAALIKEHTQKVGFDAGRIWRYLRRDLRSGVPQEDGAEWDGDTARGMFLLAYHCGEDPRAAWDLYLDQAYHAADVAVYHGSWMERLECSATFTSPIPKARFGGMLQGYLETGDPYLLDVCRAVGGVYMAMESMHQPRFCMGRDAYPITSLLALWDYSAEPLYLDFARQTAMRLLATQMADGGFSGQAGAGVFSGMSCLPAANSISFGSGLLAPVALMEWATRDARRPTDFPARLRRWADLVLRLQPEDGVWVDGKGAPYPLIGAGKLFSLVKAGELLGDPACAAAVRRYVDTMNTRKDCVSGTHAFLTAQYAHILLPCEESNSIYNRGSKSKH